MLEHVNPKAAGMGRLKLASLCRAVGIEAPSDSCELHDLPVTVQVIQEIRKDTGKTVIDRRTGNAIHRQRLSRPTDHRLQIARNSLLSMIGLSVACNLIMAFAKRV